MGDAKSILAWKCVFSIKMSLPFEINLIKQSVIIGMAHNDVQYHKIYYIIIKFRDYIYVF